MILNRIAKTTAFATGFAILYFSAIQHIISKSLTDEGAHAPLIVGVSLYLIWIKRKELNTLPVKPALLPGAAIAVLGCFMLFAGKLSGTMLIQHVSMVPVILGTIWLFLGIRFLELFLCRSGI